MFDHFVGLARKGLRRKTFFKDSKERFEIQILHPPLDTGHKLNVTTFRKPRTSSERFIYDRFTSCIQGVFSVAFDDISTLPNFVLALIIIVFILKSLLHITRLFFVIVVVYLPS